MPRSTTTCYFLVCEMLNCPTVCETRELSFVIKQSSQLLCSSRVVFQCGEEGRAVHGRCSGGQPRQSPGEPTC